tara:strand:- start:3881 stop:4048 length:168 start_codon:yes stop_codon:yes gene_type:complete
MYNGIIICNSMRSYKMKNINDEKEMLFKKWKMEEDEIEKRKRIGRNKNEIKNKRR